MRHVSIAVILTSWLFSLNLLAAAEQTSAEFGPVASLVNDQTVCIVRLDVSRIDFSALEKQVLEPLCQSDTDRIQLSTAIAKCRKWQRRLQNEGGRQVFFVTTLKDSSAFSDLRYPERVLIARTFVVVPGVKVGMLQDIVDSVQGARKDPQAQAPRAAVVCQEMGASTIIAFGGLMEKVRSLQAAPRPELEKALAAAGDQPLCTALAPPPIFALAAEQFFAEPVAGADQPLGKTLGRGIQWIAAGLDPSADQFRTAAIIQSADAAAANSFADLLRRLAVKFGKFLFESDKDFPSDTEAVLQSMVPGVQNDQLVLSLNQKQAAGLRTFAQKAYSAAMADTYRHQSVNNLKEICLGLLDYEDKKHQLPDRAIRDKEGKPLLSWRVAILPEVEEGALYKEFHLDEPWDSDYNRKLIERMPEVYRNPDTWRRYPGRTRYLAPIGESLAFPPDHGIPLKDFTDGTSKTIMVVEVDLDHAVIWTKPDDLEVDLDNPTRGLAVGNRIFDAGFSDAHVEGIAGTIKPSSLRAMFTRNGGEVIPRDDE